MSSMMISLAIMIFFAHFAHFGLAKKATANNGRWNKKKKTIQIEFSSMNDERLNKKQSSNYCSSSSNIILYWQYTNCEYWVLMYCYVLKYTLFWWMWWWLVCIKYTYFQINKCSYIRMYNFEETTKQKKYHEKRDCSNDGSSALCSLFTCLHLKYFFFFFSPIFPTVF